jgi:hypothetical protein
VSRSALLWLTHVWGPEIQAEFEKISAVSSDVWLLVDRSMANAAAVAARYPRCHLFDESQVFRLPYPKMKGRRLLEHHHFPILDFFLQHREYDFYWVVEYDVRYTGDWRTLLDFYEKCDHDFITSHVRRFDQEPGWEDWESLRHPTKAIPREQRLRCFNVIHRLSNRALKFMHESQVDGWEGFTEVLLPTLLSQGEFKLLDFGHAVYTARGFRNGRLSIFGTLRYRPSRTKPGRQTNKLYHPVKPPSMMEPLGVRFRFFLRWAWDMVHDLLAANARK